MNDSVTYETTCPNSHNQTVKLSREEFNAALESDTLIFHCNTCDTNWPPSKEDIGKLRKYLGE
jgi:hypothetical protein